MTMIRPLQIAVIAFFLGGCASTRLGSFDGYERVPMDKVFPYPEEAETSQRQVGVVLAQSYTNDLPDAVVGEAVARTQKALAGFAAGTGARLIASGVDAGDLFTTGVSLDQEAGGGAPPQGPRYALITSFSRYGYSNEYTRPMNLIFKSEQEMAQKPGKCKHRVDLELGVEIYELSPAGQPTEKVKSLTLTGSDQAKTKDLDPSCPYSETQKQVLFEQALSQALECIDIPIRNSIAGSGYLTEHRKEIGGARHVFKSGLGSRSGAQKGLDVEIYRILTTTTEDGSRSVQEVKIAEGVISDQIDSDYSWIQVDLEKSQQPILQGDLARIVYRGGLGSSVPGFGGGCRGG